MTKGTEMAARILDGKQIAQDMRDELRVDVEKLKAEGVTPGLGVLLVGDDPASRSYVTAKEKACETIGIHSEEVSTWYVRLTRVMRLTASWSSFRFRTAVLSRT